MRRQLLLRSIQRWLDPDETVVDAAVVWRRHRLILPYVIAAFIGLVALTTVIELGTWTTRIGLGLAAVGVAAMAATEYRVVAQTSTGFVLLESSRIRQAATGLVKRFPGRIEIEMNTNLMVLSEWTIDGVRYTAPKSSEQPLTRMADS